MSGDKYSVTSSKGLSEIWLKSLSIDIEAGPPKFFVNDDKQYVKVILNDSLNNAPIYDYRLCQEGESINDGNLGIQNQIGNSFFSRDY